MAVVDVAVIGAGPAGAAAAVQLRRSGADFRVFEKARIGGLLWNADLVENYPGFPRGISGPGFVGLIEKQIKNAGVKVETNEVLKIAYRQGLFTLKTRKGPLQARACVIATGTEPLRLPDGLVPPEAGSRVFYEVAPLAARTRGKRIAVVGGGDAAFDYALNLSRRNDVVLLHRGRTPQCLPLLRRRAEGRPRIAVLGGIRLEAVRRTKRGLALDLLRGKRRFVLEVSYLLAAVGRKPVLGFVDGCLKKRVAALRRARRLFLVGDVKNGLFRQTAIAAGDGVRAAMEIAGGPMKRRPASRGIRDEGMPPGPLLEPGRHRPGRKAGI